MALHDLAREWSPEQVRALADDLRAGRVGDAREQRLRTLVDAASDDAQAAAIDANAAIADLIAALDLPPPPAFGLELDEEPEPAEPDVEVEREQPEALFGVPTDQLRERDGGGRPDPRAVGQTGLTDRFPQPTLREEFFRLESARRNAAAQRGTDVPPGQFYDEFADDILGNHALSREEFVDAEESPESTGFFT